jgi:AcrR family transcriptional regulator
MPPPRPPDYSPANLEANLGDLLTKERLPAGRGDLSEPVLAHSQRERILVALAESVAQKGYEATTVTDIVKAAGVSRPTFFELFENKEDCLHAAMELSLADLMGRIVSAYSPDKPWPTMVRDSAAALLELLATRPAFARMAFVEAPAASARAFELWRSGKRVLLALLDRGREDAMEEEGIPSSAGRAALASAESLIVGQILAGNTRQLRELLPDVVYIATVPYLGQDEALRQSREAEKTVASMRA